MESITPILHQLGEDRENYYNAVAPAQIQSSNFCFDSVSAMRESLKQEFDIPFYTRGYNPTVAILRKKLAALEQTEDALVCSSGSAAVAIAVMGNLKTGDHVICVQKPYSWTTKLFSNLLSRYGVEVTYIEGDQMENFQAALRNETRLVFIESPNSMTFEMQDIRAVAAFCKANNLISIIDNSYSSPVFQKPCTMGIDISVHSATKYLNGHSDVVAGAICASSEMIKKLFSSEWMTLGCNISPNDAWLLIRGLRTLDLRVNRSADTAAMLVPLLESHPKVEKVLWPFAESNPQKELAQSQMSRCAGMFSLVVKSDSIDGVERFCDSLQHFLLACSWGGYESLAFPVCALEAAPSYKSTTVSRNLVRLYIGLEDPMLLKEDLMQALEKV